MALLAGLTGYGGRGSPVGSEEDYEPGSTVVNPIGLPLSELKKLKERFHRDGQMLRLTLDQFVDALSSSHPKRDAKEAAAASKHAIVATGTGDAASTGTTVTSKEQPLQGEEAAHVQRREELKTLFKKIDAACTNAVDWEEFTTYMLLHMPRFNAAEGASELAPAASPQAAENFAAAWSAGHQGMITDIMVTYDHAVGAGPGGAANAGVAGSGQRRYITAGRDGFVKVWLPDLRLHREIDVGQNKSWLSALCWMQRSRRLVVASSRFKIYFYDGSFSPAPLAHIDHKDSTPLCLGYTSANESDGREKEILMVGDNHGCVTVYAMDEDWTEQELEKEKEGGRHLFSERSGVELKFSSKPTKRAYHTDWVTKVGFVPELQYMVTCGLDGEINLCDVHVNQRKEGRDVVRFHKKGVHSWCWCSSYKFFASGGLDRQVIIWNPYTQRYMNSLQGHNGSILDVLVNEGQHQLISLSVDKVVKVWDIRNFRCVQTFTDKTEYKPEDRLTCMAFDEEGPALVLCSSTLNVLPVNVKVDTSRTHPAPIVAALYNSVFHQVVSGDSLGTICIWDVRTGKLDFEFKAHGPEHKLTCMAFDPRTRGLYTGSEDGVVKLWNFSSGQQLRRYSVPRPAEITSLLWAREGPNTFVVGLAWDRSIYVWPDSKKQTVEVINVLSDNTGSGHIDDITSICRCHGKDSTGNGLLATAGDDGYVIFWKIQDTAAKPSSRRFRLCDNTPSTPAVSEKQAAPPSTRRRKVLGRRDTANFSSEMDAATGPGGGAKAGEASGPVGGTGSLDVPTLSTQVVMRGRGSRVAPAPAATAGAARNHVEEEAGPQPGLASVASQSSHHGQAATSQSGALTRENAAAIENFWPEEVGLEDESATMRADGVECMIFLEHQECLLSTHADRKVRLWSTKKSEFLQRVDLVKKPQQGEEGEEQPAHEADPVPAQLQRVTALYSDSGDGDPEVAKGNRWLFTGDAEGYVRVWDLEDFWPGEPGRPVQRQLMMLHELQPHHQSVTHLQHFELDGQVVIISASTDCTIVLSTMAGDRIGTFCSKGPYWQLSERASWIATLPLEDIHRATEDDGWGRSPPRARQAGGRHGQGRNAAGAAGGGRAAAGASGRSPRSAVTTTGQGVHGGQGIFKKLVAVDRFKPDLAVAEQERQHLGRHAAREHATDRLATTTATFNLASDRLGS